MALVLAGLWLKDESKAPGKNINNLMNTITQACDVSMPRFQPGKSGVLLDRGGSRFETLLGPS